MARRVVLADDSETIRKVVELVLEPEGFSVAAYRDGEEAMRAILSQPPDLVLADIDLPQLSGILLCRSLKDNADTASVPVILLVGAFEPFDEDAARLSGADDIIVKPFESKELVSKTKALLGRQPAAVPSSPPVPAVQDSSADEEASLDAELARQWAMAVDDSGAGGSADGLSSEQVLPETSAPEAASSAIGDAISPEPALTDEELAKQWAAAMGDDGEQEQSAVSGGAEAAAADVPSELPDDDLARQWEASLLEDAEQAPATAVVSTPESVPERSSFSELLSAEMETPVLVNTEPGQKVPAGLPEQMIGAAQENVLQSPITPDEIRAMVRTAVDEALAELLQSERSRIQKEFESTVRKTVKDVAEAILLRELDKSVSAE